jgi:S1-C subfamily serine protease
MLSAISAPLFAQNTPPTAQLPEDFRGIKVYKLPTKNGQPQAHFGIYRKISYEAINFERLQLSLAVSIRAVDHPATVEHIYFQDVRANGIPVHIDAFNQEFKLSNKAPVDVPAPLRCDIVFADLDSLQPVRDMVDKDKILITGQSFIEVKLGTLEAFAALARHVVVPVPLNEEVPLNLFEGKPLLHITATTILDNLVTPTSTAAINMAKEHLARLRTSQSLGGKVKSALYLLLTQYQVRDPKSNAAEQFSQSGTGFLVSADGKLLTSKRVVAPWKYDPDVEFLIEHQHMVLDKNSVKIYAWPAGALVMGLDGQPDLPSALSTDHQSVKFLGTAPDETVQQDYLDLNSGKKVTVHLFAEGLSDVAVLQLSGTNFQPLTFPDGPAVFAPEASPVLCSYPFGISQPQATPRLLTVPASLQGNLVKMEHSLDPGESGAPLLNADGKVVGLATSGSQAIPIQVAQKLIP